MRVVKNTIDKHNDIVRHGVSLCRSARIIVVALIGMGIAFVLFYSLSYETANADIIECKKICRGSDGTDVLVGNRHSNRMNGLDGTDFIIGLFGNDRIVGYNGSDFLMGAAGDDVIHGGYGHDAIMGGTGNDNITGSYGADEIIGGEGNDTIRGGSGPDTIIGGEGADIIVGGSGADVLIGGNDDDMIYGADLNSTDSDNAQDIILCGEGHDEVWTSAFMDENEDQISIDCETIHK